MPSTITTRRIQGLHATGLSSRKPTVGPENDLVLEYVADYLPKAPRGQQRQIFLEPAIESGFPDVVAVYSSVVTTRKWSAQRASLRPMDIRIAHFLAMRGDTGTEDLALFFGNRGNESVQRLCGAGLVLRTAMGWRLRSLREVFAVRRLIAIEAKIADWKDGLEQAFQNTWFASESYLLLPKLPKCAAVIDEMRRFGVGLITRGMSLDSSAVSARQDNIPKSYASWLFNEWAWQLTDAI